jgi:hypothetical protein
MADLGIDLYTSAIPMNSQQEITEVYQFDLISSSILSG